MFLCQTALCCSLRLPAWCIFHDNVWEAQKNLRISSWTDPGGELHRNSRRTAASFQTGREDRNHSVKHPGTCESKFPNSTKLANEHYVFVPLIMSFQEGYIRSLHDTVRIRGLWLKAHWEEEGSPRHFYLLAVLEQHVWLLIVLVQCHVMCYLHIWISFFHPPSGLLPQIFISAGKTHWKTG